jgi:hypothetical protein
MVDPILTGRNFKILNKKVQKRQKEKKEMEV